MINESRIKLMTKMAVYENGEGKRSKSIGTYFRGDYIGKEVIKSILYGTLAFVIIFALYVCYNLEFFLQDIYKIDLLAFGKEVLFNYLKLVVTYGIITYIVYALRYQKARTSLRNYFNNLRRLSSMYRKEAKGRDSRAKTVREERPKIKDPKAKDPKAKDPKGRDPKGRDRRPMQ